MFYIRMPPRNFFTNGPTLRTGPNSLATTEADEADTARAEGTEATLHLLMHMFYIRMAQRNFFTNGPTLRTGPNSLATTEADEADTAAWSGLKRDEGMSLEGGKKWAGGYFATTFTLGTHLGHNSPRWA